MKNFLYYLYDRVLRYAEEMCTSCSLHLCGSDYILRLRRGSGFNASQSLVVVPARLFVFLSMRSTGTNPLCAQLTPISQQNLKFAYKEMSFLLVQLLQSFSSVSLNLKAQIPPPAEWANLDRRVWVMLF